ncbi:MAG TPA: hypothetical protein HA306_02550 [Methanosarcina sp.]|nr:hypothetical protein [Methanosarcina sp.]
MENINSGNLAMTDFLSSLFLNNYNFYRLSGDTITPIKGRTPGYELGID